MSSVTLGVISFPSRTMNRFSALPSDTWPSMVSTIASSYPLSTASLLEKALLAYPPTILARAGSAWSLLRRQETTCAVMPRSMAMYSPNGTAKMSSLCSRLCSRTPIASVDL